MRVRSKLLFVQTDIKLDSLGSKRAFWNKYVQTENRVSSNSEWAGAVLCEMGTSGQAMFSASEPLKLSPTSSVKQPRQTLLVTMDAASLIQTTVALADGTDVADLHALLPQVVAQLAQIDKALDVLCSVRRQRLLASSVALSLAVRLHSLAKRLLVGALETAGSQADRIFDIDTAAFLLRGCAFFQCVSQSLPRQAATFCTSRPSPSAPRVTWTIFRPCSSKDCPGHHGVQRSSPSSTDTSRL
jgi:hypothetical protein